MMNYHWKLGVFAQLCKILQEKMQVLIYNMQWLSLGAVSVCVIVSVFNAFDWQLQSASTQMDVTGVV